MHPITPESLESQPQFKLNLKQTALTTVALLLLALPLSACIENSANAAKANTPPEPPAVFVVKTDSGIIVKTRVLNESKITFNPNEVSDMLEKLCQKSIPESEVIIEFKNADQSCGPVASEGISFGCINMTNPDKPAVITVFTDALSLAQKKYPDSKIQSCKDSQQITSGNNNNCREPVVINNSLISTNATVVHELGHFCHQTDLETMPIFVAHQYLLGLTNNPPTERLLFDIN